MTERRVVVELSREYPAFVSLLKSAQLFPRRRFLRTDKLPRQWCQGYRAA